jgi:hypothetical protein
MTQEKPQTIILSSPANAQLVYVDRNMTQELGNLVI